MAHIYPHIFFGDAIVPQDEARLHVASSAVLYGLSVYSVFPLLMNDDAIAIFRLDDHIARLRDSAQTIGIDFPEILRDREKFLDVIREISHINAPTETVFARVTLHVDALVAGTRARGLHTVMSIFLYEAQSIVPQDGMRLKTSPWRRNPDFSIPSRAKVNGGYVNSVLAKQDALDSGYDDAIFLDITGHVAELSAANIFILRNGVLITPSVESDILEGINRRTILEIAREIGIPTEERRVDMTELYIADEVFVTGTSAYVAGVSVIDGRTIGQNNSSHMTELFARSLRDIQSGKHPMSAGYLTYL